MWEGVVGVVFGKQLPKPLWFKSVLGWWGGFYDYCVLFCELRILIFQNRKRH